MCPVDSFRHKGLIDEVAHDVPIRRFDDGHHAAANLQ
jgi:hypothetical protein